MAAETTEPTMPRKTAIEEFVSITARLGVRRGVLRVRVAPVSDRSVEIGVIGEEEVRLVIDGMRSDELSLLDARSL